MSAVRLSTAPGGGVRATPWETGRVQAAGLGSRVASGTACWGRGRPGSARRTAPCLGLVNFCWRVPGARRALGEVRAWGSVVRAGGRCRPFGQVRRPRARFVGGGKVTNLSPCGNVVHVSTAQVLMSPRSAGGRPFVTFSIERPAAAGGGGGDPAPGVACRCDPVGVRRPATIGASGRRRQRSMPGFDCRSGGGLSSPAVRSAAAS